MNLKGNLKRRFLFIFIYVIAVLVVSLGVTGYLTNKARNKTLEITEGISKEKSRAVELTERFVEISPDGTKQVILYERPFTGKGKLDYRNYLSNQYLFTIRELENWYEHYVFVGDDRVGYPHWLGNTHIFFTAGCGTGCKGLYLVDTRSKESLLAVITTTISENNFKTHFRDWFDNEFNLAGWAKHIRSVTFGGKPYLIFEMWNNDQSIGEKRFLFTGKELIEETEK